MTVESKTDPIPAAEWVPVDTLIPWARNPRKNDHRIPEAVASLRRFGFCAPMLGWRAKGRLVAGHLRIKAMRVLLAEDPGLDGHGGADPDLAERNQVLRASLTGPTVAHLPLRWRDFASKAEADAYALRDNNPIGEWDDGGLAEVLASLEQEGTDMTGLGWDEGEIKALLGRQPDAEDLPTPDGPDSLTERFTVLVECDDEAQQVALLEQFHRDGLRCRALIV